MFETGTDIGGWRIDEVLHQGSMAITYRVHAADGDGTPHVMKMLFVRDPSFQERLRRSASVLVSVRHPHLVPVVGLVEHDGMQGIVSAFIDGTDLGTWAAEEERPLTELMPLFLQLTRGLKAAHKHGLVHRNLKPEKVLIDLTGRPHIHDFMLGKVMATEASAAAVTQLGTTFGTPQYMAPEQFRGAAQVDERADLFSLGCLLFELVAGRRAFEGKGLMDIYSKVAAGEHPALSTLRDDVPHALDQLVSDLLQPDPDQRIPTADAVIARVDSEPALRQLINPLHSTATPVSALTTNHPSSPPASDPVPASEPHIVRASIPPMTSGDPHRSIIDFDSVDDSDDDDPELLPPPKPEPVPQPQPEPRPEPKASEAETLPPEGVPVQAEEPVRVAAPTPAPPPGATAPLPVVPAEPGISMQRAALLLALMFVVAVGLGALIASQF